MHRLFKVDVLDLHNEGEDVAADIANPALEGLTRRIDLKAWSGVVMPRATTDVVRALASQRDVPSDKVDDIDRVADLFALIEGTALESSQIRLLASCFY